MNFAPTVFHPAVSGSSAVRVLRFDRTGRQRHMCVSAASLLQAEYPGLLQTDRWSYPRLAEELRRVGSPAEDRRELFGRMVFNAVCGNDDDHVRNHAIVYSAEERRWRLTPAFDVVPNPVEIPRRLQMQLSLGRFDISREAVLADAHRFGFTSKEDAAAYLDALLERIASGFDSVAHWLDQEWLQTLHERLAHNVAVLKVTYLATHKASRNLLSNVRNMFHRQLVAQAFVPQNPHTFMSASNSFYRCCPSGEK